MDCCKQHGIHAMYAFLRTHRTIFDNRLISMLLGCQPAMNSTINQSLGYYNHFSLSLSLSLARSLSFSVRAFVRACVRVCVCVV